MLSKKAAYVVDVNIAQRLSEKLAIPAAPALRHRLIKHSQYAFVSVFRVYALCPRPRFVVEGIDAGGGKPCAPYTDDPRHDTHFACNGARCHTIGSQQNDTGAPDHALLALRRPHPAFEPRASFRIEPDWSCLISHPKLESRFAGLAKGGPW